MELNPLSVAERLRRLGIGGGAGPKAPTPPAAPAEPLALDVPGVVRRSGAGSFVLVEHRFPLDHRHGHGVLGDAFRASARHSALAGKAADYAAVAPERRAYLDTETTSLNSGAGVLVFLVGIGYLDRGAFVVEQYFMRHPGEERAMLEALGTRLGPFEALVTFHGKSFDCPRTRDRFLFQDLPDGLPKRTHLDLYHAARRLFRHRFPECRLQVFERELLGFARIDDLPGAQCPEVYFRYLRGEENRIARVLEHNLHDVLTLAGLEARVARSFTEPDDAVERLSAGVLAFDQGEAALARDHLIASVTALAHEPARHSGVPVVVGLRAARALRRLDAAGPARELLELLFEQPGAAVRVARELAILWERQLRDPSRALAVVERALELLGGPVEPRDEEQEVASAARAARSPGSDAASFGAPDGRPSARRREVEELFLRRRRLLALIQ